MHLKFTIFSLLSLLLSTLYGQTIEVEHPNPKYGIFSTYSLEVQPLNDGTERVRTLEELVYIDPRGKRWTAPAGSVVDGASIPELFQDIMGTPFGGDYTLASVIHDVACVEQREYWEEVHRVFYDAMMASGVEEKKAKMMYLAVYEGGARWGENMHKHLTQEEILRLLDVNNIESLVGVVKPFVERLLFKELKESINLSLDELFNDFNIKIEKREDGLIIKMNNLNEVKR